MLADESRLSIFLGTISVPSRVMPGLRGTPAGMRTISAPFKHALMPSGVGSYPFT